MNVIEQTYDPAIDINSIKQHPENPNVGDDELVGESIEAVGFFGAVLVQKSTGYVIAGNTRYRSVTAKGGESIPGFWIDCDDDTARFILAADNGTAERGHRESDRLLALLSQIEESRFGLLGTGYDETYMAILAGEDDDDGGGLPPDEFPDLNPDDLETSFRCPSCQYEWSGSPRPGDPAHEPHIDEDDDD